MDQVHDNTGGAVLATDFDIAIPGGEITGGKPWSAKSVLPLFAQLTNMKREIVAANGDEIKQAAAMEKVARACLVGEPSGWASPVTWDEIKAKAEVYYFGVMGYVVRRLQEASAAPRLEEKRKN